MRELVFQAEVRTLTARLLDYPESAPSILRDVRRAGVRRFPYDLVYRIRGDRDNG